MLSKAQQLHRPLIRIALLGWISYVFLTKGIVMEIIVPSLAIVIANTTDS